MDTPETPDETPVIPAAALGYRGWKVRYKEEIDEEADSGKHDRPPIKLGPLRLSALAFSDYLWEPGDNIAVCAAEEDHKAPAEDCTCGFYCVHDIQDLYQYSLTRDLIGAVVVRGLLQIHSDGVRAEQARIIAFCDPQLRESSKLAAKEYDVPLFSDSFEFQRYARQLAQPVPCNQRPKPEEREKMKSRYAPITTPIVPSKSKKSNPHTHRLPALKPLVRRAVMWTLLFLTMTLLTLNLFSGTVSSLEIFLGGMTTITAVFFFLCVVISGRAVYEQLQIRARLRSDTPLIV